MAIRARFIEGMVVLGDDDDCTRMTIEELGDALRDLTGFYMTVLKEHPLTPDAA